MFLMKNGEIEDQTDHEKMKTKLNGKIGSLLFQTQVKNYQAKQLTIFIKERKIKYRTTAENINVDTGNITSKIEDINSTTKNGPHGEEEIVTCKYVGIGGYIPNDFNKFFGLRVGGYGEQIR